MFTMLTVIILFCGTTDVLLEPSFMRFWVNERNLHCSQALRKLWQPAETWHPASSQILSPLSSPSLLCTWPDKRNHRWMGLTVQSCQKLNRSFLNNKVGAFICLQSRILAVTTKVIATIIFFQYFIHSFINSHELYEKEQHQEEWKYHGGEKQLSTLLIPSL